MARQPKGRKGPGDIVTALKAPDAATGAPLVEPTGDGKDPAAKSLGSRGGKARAASLSKTRRSEIAKGAAAKRWGPKVPKIK